MKKTEYEPVVRVSERDRGWYDPKRRIVDYHDMYPDIAEDEPRPELEGVELASSLIDALMEKLNLHDGMYEEDLRGLWGELVGEFVARHSQPESFVKGHLVIKVSEATVRTHLMQTTRVLLKKLQDKLGAEQIRSIRFQLG